MLIKNPQTTSGAEILPRVERRLQSERLYSAIDLFAGCGGLSLGLENSGFTTVFVNELNNDALATYLANRHHSLGGMEFAKNKNLRCNDAHELQGKRLDQLRSDLKSISEIDLHLHRRGTKSGGSSLDIIAGGPPCQGFSGIGHRRSYSVDKKDIPANQLYARMAEIIRDLRPRMFLFENVRGLLNSSWIKGGTKKIWPDVLAEFRSIPGYAVRWKLVHAKNYGVPQNRPRVLMVGVRDDVHEACQSINLNADPEDAVACGMLPAPLENSYPHLEELLGDLVDPEIAQILRSGNFKVGTFESTRYAHPPKGPFQKRLRQVPPDRAAIKRVALTEQEYSKHKPDVVAKFDYMIRHNGEIPEQFRTKKFSQRILKRNWGTQGPTITATSLPDDYVHFSQPRILTVREWARLQLFPDWYQFVGKRTTGGLRRAGNPREGIFDREVPKYTQIGNAVPVGLAEHVGAHFRSILDEALGLSDA